MSLKAVPPAGARTGAHLPAPPADLGTTGRELWGKLVKDYGIDDEHGKAVLEVACRAADRAETCRATVAKAGLVVKDRWRQVRPHPLLAVERAARAQMLAALKQLALPIPEGD